MLSIALVMMEVSQGKIRWIAIAILTALREIRSTWLTRSMATQARPQILPTRLCPEVLQITALLMSKLRISLWTLSFMQKR